MGAGTHLVTYDSGYVTILHLLVLCPSPESINPQSKHRIALAAGLEWAIARTAGEYTALAARVSTLHPTPENLATQPQPLIPKH